MSGLIVTRKAGIYPGLPQYVIGVPSGSSGPAAGALLGHRHAWGWLGMDIADIAREFIEVNQQRKEIERKEEYLKGLLAEHFRTARTSWIETEKGKVGYLESQKVDYDIDMLRKALPQEIFELVTKVSVNDSVLMQLIKDGKVDPKDIERARRISSIRRVVVARTLW